MIGKGEQTQTLNFFPVLTCLSDGSNALFGAPPEFGARKLSSPYIFVAGVQLTSLLYHFSPSTEKVMRRPLTSALCRRQGHPLPLVSVHAYKNFGPPVFLSHPQLQQNLKSCCSETVLFIHSFIYSISTFHELFNYVA